MKIKTKKRKSSRATGSKLSRTHVNRVLERKRVTGPDTSTGTVADSAQSVDRGDVLLYQAEAGIALEVRVQGDTVWLTQPQMAKLFDRERSVVTTGVAAARYRGARPKTRSTLPHGRGPDQVGSRLIPESPRSRARREDVVIKSPHSSRPTSATLIGALATR
jgi:hypothetical protein